MTSTTPTESSANTEEQQALQEAWEALQSVPSYVERLQDNPELIELEEKQENRQMYSDALRALRWD